MKKNGWWVPLLILFIFQSIVGVVAFQARDEGKTANDHIEDATYVGCVNQNKISVALKEIVAVATAPEGSSLAIPPELIAMVQDPAMREILNLVGAPVTNERNTALDKRADEIIIRNCEPLQP